MYTARYYRGVHLLICIGSTIYPSGVQYPQISSGLNGPRPSKGQSSFLDRAWLFGGTAGSSTIPILIGIGIRRIQLHMAAGLGHLQCVCRPHRGRSWMGHPIFCVTVVHQAAIINGATQWGVSRSSLLSWFRTMNGGNSCKTCMDIFVRCVAMEDMQR